MSHIQDLYKAQTYQVLSPSRKTASNGHVYLAFKISDGEKTYTAHAWAGQYHGPDELHHGQRVHITGQWRDYNGKFILKCKTIAPTQAKPLAQRKALTRIRAMLLKLPTSPLKTFVCEVFADPGILHAFLSLPASQHHHHAYPGGLFIHSVDTAWRIYINPSLQGREKNIAVVAALLHDIGKVATHTREGRLTSMGRYVNHDALTLSVLDAALKRLDARDEITALLLRHYLTWNPRKRSIPRSTGAAYVRTADMASTAVELQRGG